MWRIYGTLNDWIRFSDTKAGVILATNGVVAGAVFSDPTGPGINHFPGRTAEAKNQIQFEDWMKIRMTRFLHTFPGQLNMPN
ncbi:MAG: hypothetical protein IH589_08790 [Anaerolineales bacterium]|nr:hypothetical protein [Anaerolineales bacterium]